MFDEDRIYTDYTSMAYKESIRQDGIDAVVIATPNYLHFPVAKEFIKKVNPDSVIWQNVETEYWTTYLRKLVLEHAEQTGSFVSKTPLSTSTTDFSFDHDGDNNTNQLSVNSFSG